MRFNATLQYTISHRLMGRVRIACAGACKCMPHDLDGHAVFRIGNMTIYTEHTLQIELAAPAPAAEPAASLYLAGQRVEHGGAPSPSCTLTLTVLPGTSSGGHYFKVRDIVLHENVSPCKGHEKLVKGWDRSAAESHRALLNRRNDLHCGGGDA